MRRDTVLKSLIPSLFQVRLLFSLNLGSVRFRLARSFNTRGICNARLLQLYTRVILMPHWNTKAETEKQPDSCGRFDFALWYILTIWDGNCFVQVWLTVPARYFLPALCLPPDLAFYLQTEVEGRFFGLRVHLTSHWRSPQINRYEDRQHSDVCCLTIRLSQLKHLRAKLWPCVLAQLTGKPGPRITCIPMACSKTASNNNESKETEVS